MKELEAFEAWWIAQETGLGTAHKFTAWNAWLARAAVEADRAQRVPDGWKLVPVEPTAEMLDAGRKACNGNMYPQDMLHGPRAMMADRWYAAINAAPSLLITTPAPAQQERKPMTDSFTTQEITDACIYAEISDGQFQSVLIALQDNRRHHGIFAEPAQDIKE